MNIPKPKRGERQPLKKGHRKAAPGKKKVFISYSHKDERLRQQLAYFMKGLEREGLIVSWFDGQIPPGNEVDAEILKQLSAAHIVLCLVSAPFLASDYIYRKEMRYALARHRTLQVRIVPIILRPCEWERSPLGRLRALPKDGRPISQWQDRHEGFLDVVRELRNMLLRVDSPLPSRSKNCTHQKKEEDSRMPTIESGRAVDHAP